MLTELTAYEYPDFYAAHPQAYLLTPEMQYKITFFSGYVASDSDLAWELSFSNNESLEAWCEQQASLSLFHAPPAPEDISCVVTLSTCSYDFEDARFVLHGWLSEIQHP